MTEVFKTYIGEDNIKTFNYQITLEKKQRKPSNSRGQSERGGRESGGGRGGKGGGGKGGGGKGGGKSGGKGGDRDHADEEGDHEQSKKNDRIKKLLDESLAKKLAVTGYCQKGHSIDSEELRRNAAVVSGQCVDEASEQDHHKFPNDDTRSSIVPEEDLSKIYNL